MDTRIAGQQTNTPAEARSLGVPAENIVQVIELPSLCHPVQMRVQLVNPHVATGAVKLPHIINKNHSGIHS